MPVYKIQNKKTGRFMTKTKSSDPWTENGNVYDTIGGCKSAIKTRWKRWKEDRSCIDIIEFELVPTGRIIELREEE